MNDQTDSQLLRAYGDQRSEAAFAELVRRHLDFVYSAALRMVRDSHLAEDVAQGVFLALAKDARRLANRPVLSGWLHRTARNISVQTIRADARRRAREQEAAIMNEVFSGETDAAWEEIAPHLDAALGELNESDRAALILRYFERKSAPEMAQALGLSDDAAQKRVSRAVERLGNFLARRGITVGASGLVLAISSHAIQAAPQGLKAAIATTTACSPMLLNGTGSFAAWMKTKIAACLLASVCVTGLTTVVVIRSSPAPENLAEEVRGIGLALARDRKTSAATVMIVVPGSVPARAGLVKGLSVHAIDGVSTAGMPLPEILRRIAEHRVVRLALIDPIRNVTNTIQYTHGGPADLMGGIGIALSRDQNSPATIMAVTADSTAAQAGLSKGMIIHAIDGVLTEGMNPRECLNRIQGAPGSVVRLQLINPKLDLTNMVELTRYRL